MSNTQWSNRIVDHGEVEPDQLLANPQNWRVHPRFQQQALTAALGQLGWIQRVIVNRTTGHVVDGHLRVAVSLTEGQRTVPVSYVDLTPEEERLALATFDPISSLAVADETLLTDLLKDVRPLTTDPSLEKLLTDLSTGALTEVVSGDLDALLGDQEEKAPTPGLSQSDGLHKDQVAAELVAHGDALRARWGVELGQVWEVRSGTDPAITHRLLVGSCTDPVIVHQACSGRRLPEGTVLVTSPPYGMGQSYEPGFQANKPTKHRGKGDPGSRDRLGGRPTAQGIEAWRDLIWGFTETWGSALAAACIDLADHTVAPTPGYGRHTYGDLVDACENAGWPLVATRFWYKGPNWGNNAYWLSTYKPVPEFEYVGFFADLEKFPTKRISERVPQSEEWRFRSMWQFGSVPSQQADTGHHPAAFPVELPRRAILLFTDPGGTVVDPFCGSGTTLVAAEGLGRQGIGVEIEPVFAAMTLERMSRLGLTPRKT